MATPQQLFTNTSFNFPAKKIIPPLVLFVVAFIFFRSIVTFVPPGHVGVVYDRGRGVLDQPLREGINIMIPFWQTSTLYDIRLQEYTMSTVRDEGALIGDDSLDAPTSDGQTVTVDATVLFRVDSQKAPEVFKTIGENYTDKLVRPFSRSQIRMVISRYSAPAIYSEKRQEAEKVMTEEIRELLKDKNIIVDKVLLRSVNFSPEYSAAIEDKVIAEQRVKQAEFEVLEASQRAQAKIQEAKGLSEAQALQRQTLTQEFLQFEAIKKWDGHLPQAIGSSNSVPFINLPVGQ